jgi:hypothetical protein
MANSPHPYPDGETARPERKLNDQEHYGELRLDAKCENSD